MTLNIQKVYANEPAPYDPKTNSLINFSLKAGIYDFDSTYLNLPITLPNKYIYNGSPAQSLSNAVSYAQIYSNDLAQLFSVAHVRRARLETKSGTTIYECNDINRLMSSLDPFLYDNAMTYTEQYLSNVRQELYPLMTDFEPNRSAFRVLNLTGTESSYGLTSNARLKISSLFPGLPNGKFRKFNEDLILTIELDPESHFSVQEDPQPNDPLELVTPLTYEIVENTSTANALGYPDFQFGIVTGQSVLTLTITNLTLTSFPYGVGDFLGITGVGITGNADITTITMGANDVVTSVTISGTADATVNNGLIVANTSVPNSRYFQTAKNIVLTEGNTYRFGTSTGALNGDILESVLLNIEPGATYNHYLFDEPLWANGNGDRYIMSVPYLFDDLGAQGNFTQITSTGDISGLWVGCAVYIVGTNVTPTLATITSIEPTNGNTQSILTFNMPITVTSGQTAEDVLVYHWPATPATPEYNQKLELVTYKLNEQMLPKDAVFDNVYNHFRLEADTVYEIPLRGTAEKTFNLEEGVSAIVVCLCNGDNLISDIGALDNYQILVDGKATTSRQIKLQSESYKNERLINGFNYLPMQLANLNLEDSPMNTELNTYLLIDSIPVDGNQHKLTVRLTNGDDSVYSQRIMRVFKLNSAMLMS